MATAELELIQQDLLVMSVARALAIANKTAHAQGKKPENCLVTISEEPSADGESWRIHYGPRDFVRQRGGDLTIIVSGRAGVVERILRGQ